MNGGVLMLIRVLACATILTTLMLGAVPGLAQDTPCSKGGIATYDGACWNSLSANEKTVIVVGIWAGQRSATNAAALEGNIIFSYPRDWTETPTSTTTSDIVDYFNLLYKTPANRGVLWEWAYILATMNVRDDNTSDRPALLAFLRQYGSVPTSGKVVAIKAPDVITISADQGQFDIHLAGVTSEGMSDAQKDMTVSFLRGLTERTDFLLMNMTACSRPGNLNVSLSYHSLFFKGRMLSPLVVVRSAPFTALCLGTRVVPVSTLGPHAPKTGFDELYLNSSLVSWGLALPEKVEDPKLPDRLADWDDYEAASKQAKKDGLYIYGSQRDPSIDQIIAAGSTEQHSAN